MSAPRVLFLAPDTEDYLADSLLHGLRTLLGDRCVDWPKCERLYDTYPEAWRPRLYGKGFTLYGGLLPDVEIDRWQVLRQAQLGAYDLVVLGELWKSWGWWVQLQGKVPLAICDGSDYPFPFPWSHRTMGRPLRFLTLPRRSRRTPYFKRELYRGRRMRPIAFSIPAEHVVADVPAKTKLLPEHIVDTDVAELVGRTGTGWAFDSQEEYYADLQASRFGITIKREGWEAMRHYELAANRCVPCVRDLQRKPPRCAPHGLVDGVNCVVYTDGTQLLRRLEAMPDSEYQRLQEGVLTWVEANTTVARAEQFLRALGWDVSAA